MPRFLALTLLLATAPVAHAASALDGDATAVTLKPGLWAALHVSSLAPDVTVRWQLCRSPGRDGDSSALPATSRNCVAEYFFVAPGRAHAVQRCSPHGVVDEGEAEFASTRYRIRLDLARRHGAQVAHFTTDTTVTWLGPDCKDIAEGSFE